MTDVAKCSKCGKSLDETCENASCITCGEPLPEGIRGKTGRWRRLALRAQSSPKIARASNRSTSSAA
jgi:hypothetical protein